MATWLSDQPYNTAATAYTIRLNVSNLGDSDTLGSAGNVLGKSHKYVNIDLSGSTITIYINKCYLFCFHLKREYFHA